MSLPRRFSAALAVILMFLAVSFVLPASASAITPGVITVIYQGCGPPVPNGTTLSRPARVYLKRGSKTLADRLVKKWGVPYRFVADPGTYRIESKGMTTIYVVLLSGEAVEVPIFCNEPVS
jgi:hypothetical protein